MNPNTMSRNDLARIIDHTLLTPQATRDDVAKLIATARDLEVYAVCVSPSMLPLSDMELGHLKVATVSGFPSGAHDRHVKAYEAQLAREAGADEVDMVVNLSAVKDARWQDVYAEIAAVRAVLPRGEHAVLKVIIESAALSDHEIISVCQAARDAEADFVKTSTGFHPAGGATVAAVQVMRSAVGPEMGIKASGGIRTTDAALALVRAGATRLGLSASAQVLQGLN